MNERQMNLILMISAVVIAVIAGLGAVGMVLGMATTSFLLIFPGLLLAALAAGSGLAATIFGRRLSGVTHAFTETEQAVLSPKQRTTLRRARADVLLAKALTEVEIERDKMVSKQLEASRKDLDIDGEVHQPQPLQPDPQWHHQRKAGGPVRKVEHWED